MPTPDERPDRNLALELVRVTESAALAAARLVGMGDKEAADQAAVDAMRVLLGSVHMDGVVVIGEGEKDEAPMLYNGEHIGDGSPPPVDIAVDPLEGTTLTAKGQPNALCVVALSERGTMFDPGPCVYMEKIAVGPDGKGVVSIEQTVTENLRELAKAKHSSVRDLTAVILDRDRHADIIAEVRSVGSRIRLIPDGDVAGSLMATSPNIGVDLLWGVGGTPEGVLSAAAIKSTSGTLLGRMWPRDDDERARTVAAGIDPDRILDQDDLIEGGNCFFAATGVTDGDILKGVRFTSEEAFTTSIVMRSRSGTVRIVEGRHRRDRLRVRI